MRRQVRTAEVKSRVRRQVRTAGVKSRVKRQVHTAGVKSRVRRQVHTAEVKSRVMRQVRTAGVKSRVKRQVHRLTEDFVVVSLWRLALHLPPAVSTVAHSTWRSLFTSLYPVPDSHWSPSHTHVSKSVPGISILTESSLNERVTHKLLWRCFPFLFLPNLWNLIHIGCVRLGTHSQRRSNQRRAVLSCCGVAPLGLYGGCCCVTPTALGWRNSSLYTNPIGQCHSTTG